MFRSLLRLSHPVYLLLAALCYSLGVSIANYLGLTFRAASFWLGLGGVVLAQLSMNLLAEVFRPANEPLVDNESRKDRLSLRNNALSISYACLAVNAVIAFLLYIDHNLSYHSILFIGISLLLVLFYSISPIRLLNRGYGELILAVHLAYVIPSIGFLLQADDYHRLLFSIAVPLTALALAYFIVLDFPSFASDRKYERRTLLSLLGWERLIPLHHGLIIAAYLLFAAVSLFGYSFSLLWPAFLTLPFAILQIILMRFISLGGRPNWTLLTVTALAVFGLTAYFLILAFLLR